MVIATVVLSRSAAEFDEIHEHQLADTLTRHDRPAEFNPSRRTATITRIASTVAQKSPK